MSLAVYLSNRCNLSCPYCYLALNQGGGAALDLDRLRRGLDYFLSRAPVPGRKVTFLGGEPLLDYPLLLRAVEYLRASAGESLPVQLFTNGVLLDRRRLECLLDLGVDLTLSLHGDGLPTLDEFPKGGLGASLVVTPQSLPGLVRKVDRLYREGFRRLSFSPDLTHLWTVAEAAGLEAGLDGFVRYYRALARGGAALFEIANIYEVLREVLGPPRGPSPLCDRLILAADGRFYACDKMLGFPLERLRKLSVGSPEEGLDLGRREACFEEALDAARRTGDETGSAGRCPVGVCWLWRLRPPRTEEGLRLRLASFRQVSELFRGALDRLVRELKDDPAFLRVHHAAPEELSG